MRVFYSWQSDLPNATNRGMIQRALEDAAERIRKDDTIDIEPVIDRDTLGLSGSPSIDEAIFTKIAESDAYVADISIINQEHLALAAKGLDDEGKKKLRPTPNPNVLLELGFAVRALTWDRIVLVFNLATGDPKTDLPFDLRQKRRAEYTSALEDEDRATPRKDLSCILDDAIREIARFSAGQRLNQVAPTPSEAVIKAIEEQLPARKARLREFWTWVLSDLKACSPNLTAQKPPEELVSSLKDALDKAASVVVSWSRVCDTISFYNDAEAGLVLTDGFVAVLDEYESEIGSHRPFPDHSFDFWKFIGHELYVNWVAHLLRQRRWKVIDDILSQRFRMARRSGSGELKAFTNISEYVHLLETKGPNGSRPYCQADLLHERYGRDGIGSGLSFADFVEAEFLLFLAGEFRVVDQYSEWMHWRPWSVYYMRHCPSFISEANRKPVASQLMGAVGTGSADQLKVILRERVPELRGIWEPRRWLSPVPNDVIEAMGTTY